MTEKTTLPPTRKALLTLLGDLDPHNTNQVEWRPRGGTNMIPASIDRSSNSPTSLSDFPIMASLVGQRAATPKVANLPVGTETEPPKKDGEPKKRKFYPSLTLGVLKSRAMQSYATPCHMRGASF
jgi:hypothetical protein